MVFGRDFRKDSRPTSTRHTNKMAVVYSTPLVDHFGMETQWGYTSRGKFRGFKLHASVNQIGLPLRALVTIG